MPKEHFVCCGCGVEIMKYRCRLKNENAVFCSLDCRNKNYKKVFPEWHPPVYKGPIERTCLQCGKVYLVERCAANANKKFCSKDCHIKSQIGRAPFVMTDEIRKKQSVAQTEYCRDYGNQFSIGKSQGKHTPETCAKISRANAGKAPRWKGRVFEYHYGDRHIKMRSSYELFYAEWLDENGITWEYEPVFILSDGKAFSPDFQLEDGTIIEVKGFWAPVGKRKWEMFCQEFPDIKKRVLEKSDLINLGMDSK